MIEWLDSTSNHGWTTPSDSETLLDLGKNLSLGIVVSETQDNLLVISHKDLTAGNYLNPTTIPKGCIKRVRQLKISR